MVSKCFRLLRSGLLPSATSCARGQRRETSRNTCQTDQAPGLRSQREKLNIFPWLIMLLLQTLESYKLTRLKTFRLPTEGQYRSANTGLIKAQCTTFIKKKIIYIFFFSNLSGVTAAHLLPAALNFLKMASF